MGALTSNRKRGDDFFKINSFSTPFDQSYCHISKKPKLSASMSLATTETYRAAPSNSIASRIALYPDRKPGFPREVHAPVRNLRLGSSATAKNTEPSASPRETPADYMGRLSFFSRHLKRLRDAAIGSFRYVDTKKRKEKTVIEVDSEDEDREDVSDDSSVEELETPHDSGGRRWKGGRDNVENSQEPNYKTAEKGVRSIDSSVVTDVSNGIVKVDDVEKNGLSVLLAGDDSGVPCYRRLYDETKKRDSKLASLDYHIGLEQQRFQRHQLLRPLKKEQPKKVGLVYSSIFCTPAFLVVCFYGVAFMCRMWLRNALCLLLIRKRLRFLVPCLIP